MAIGTPVDHGGTSDALTATTIAHNIVTAVGSDACIVVAVWWTHASATCSVSGGGLTWTARGAVTATGNFKIQLFTAKAPSGLANGTTITATFSATSTNRVIEIISAPGCDDTLAGSGTDNATTPNWNGGTYTPSAANTFIVAAGVSTDDASASAAAATYTQHLSLLLASTSVHTAVHKVATTAASESPGGSFSGGTPLAKHGVSVAMAASGGAPATVPPILVMPPRIPT